MTPTELATYLDRSIPAYAADHVRAGSWEPARAEELSRAEHARLLPNGVDSPGQYLRTIVDGRSGARVGELWYAVQRDRPRPQVFLYWLGVDERHRGHGYGTAVLRAVEEEARRLGADRLALHVFGENAAAQALYAREGYVVTNVLMAKPVVGAPSRRRRPTGRASAS